MSHKYVTEAIAAFLKGQQDKHPGHDLLDRYLIHGTDLETQVNVAAGDNEPVAGKRATYDTGTYQYWNLRIPKGAYDTPEFKDYKLTWPLELHAEGIGSTGWHWQGRKSLWVGFDFDAITGHARGVGITKEKLAEVQRAAENLPYIEVRKSTGGKGIHLYVLLDSIPTANHTEHAALARCVLGMMSAEAEFDFARQIDCCGSIMWIWHRKISQDNQGLLLLKSSEKVLGLADLPSNWRDHIEVVSHKRTKVRVGGLNDESQDPFDALASAMNHTPLDQTHKDTIDELANSGYSTVWVQDYHLLQTHTCAFQQLLQDKKIKARLGLKGFFVTNSQGKNPAEPNCFAFPMRNGVWKVYRFGQGVNEDVTWEQDGKGWTTCVFNHDPDFVVTSRGLGGAELSGGKGFHFDAAKQAIEVARTLGGSNINLDDKFLFRDAVLKPDQDGKLIMKVSHEKEDRKPGEGWVKVRGGYWEKKFHILTKRNEDQLDTSEYDSRLRLVDTPNGETVGLFVKDSLDKWKIRSESKCKMWLQHQGHTKADADLIIGNCVDNAWTLVYLPFGEEYPGNRQWNYNSPQFRFKPAQLYGEQPHHPTWDKLLQHWFCDLDKEIKNLDWAKEANICNGADYGLAWIACCFRDPFEPLPFLFFFGSSESGKSTFHEALTLLTTGGVVSAQRSLTNQNGFNGELAGAVIAYVEEQDISKSPFAYNRIKEWLTAKTLWIRKMRTDAFPLPNTLHMVMMTNYQRSLSVLPGDTRITVIEVPDLLKEQEIPKRTLMGMLEEEASHFMYTLLNAELPEIKSRLRLPVIETYKKQRSIEMQRSPIETFINECCHAIPGEKVPFSDFYRKYIEWMDTEERYQWSKIKVSKEIPSEYPVGAGAGNKKFIGNLAWQPSEGKEIKSPYICINGKLRHQEEQQQ